MSALVEVRWVDDGLAVECDECGGETHYAKLAPFIKCAHCDTIRELPDQLVLKKPRKSLKGLKIAEGC
jgi:hypothetical protein